MRAEPGGKSVGLLEVPGKTASEAFDLGRGGRLIIGLVLVLSPDCSFLVLASEFPKVGDDLLTLLQILLSLLLIAVPLLTYGQCLMLKGSAGGSPFLGR